MNKTREKPEQQLFELMWQELLDRGGFDGWWYAIDSDIRDEIESEIVGIIRRELYNQHQIPSASRIMTEEDMVELAKQDKWLDKLK